MKVEKAVTPPSPLITGSHASPNGTKKTSKVKKDTPVSEKNGATGASSKRAAPQDDVVAKPKKKKVTVHLRARVCVCLCVCVWVCPCVCVWVCVCVL